MHRRTAIAWVLLTLAGCSTAGSDAPGSPAGRRDAAPAADGLTIPDAQPLPALRLDYADPDHGPFIGGTEVVLRGRGFASSMKVTVGGHLVDPLDLEVIDGNRAVIKTPAGSPGDADIHIVADGLETTREKVFLYQPIYVDPASGGTAGGTWVRIRGLGTSFHASDAVTFDGKPMTGLLVVNAQELTGYVPAGVAGAADVRIVPAGGGGELFAEDGFTYETTVDPLFAGMGGGPIDGTVNVTLVDAYTENGIPMAVAVIGDPATSTAYGITDPFGQVTISAPGLLGPITLTGGHPRYESGAMVGFDARNVAMFLTPLPPDPTEIPPSGPFPPGRSGGVVSGDVVFGGTTGIGTTDWDLVPDPRTDTERKRTYVFTTARDIFSATVDPGSGGIVDYVPGETSWSYSIPVRATAFALVAVAGLYEPDIDPDGSGPLPKGVFTPYAMGVLRNVLVGPGETLHDVSITVNIPLDSGLKVELENAPPLRQDAGPQEFRVNALIDLGGEGVIRLPGSRSVFRDKNSTILTGLAPLAYAISDASYAIAAGAYSTSLGPYSIRIVRGIRDMSKPVVIDGFIGAQRAIDPMDGGLTTQRHLMVGLDGGGGVPTFRQYRLIDLSNGNPVWRILTRGEYDEVPLYDLTRFGLPAMTSSDLYWTATSATIPGATFDTFNYGQLNANYWSAYSVATFVNVAFR